MSLPKTLFCLTCKRKETEIDLKTCSRCQFVNYCSKECQVEDFKFGDHKPFCKFMATHGNQSYEVDDENLQVNSDAMSFFIELALRHDHVKAREKTIEVIEKLNVYQKKMGFERLFDFEVCKLFFLIDLGKLQEAQEHIGILAKFGDGQQVEFPTIPDVPLLEYLNLARLCLTLIQSHEFKQNMSSYEAFKSLLESHTCLPTDPEAKLRSTVLAMEGIKRYVLGFEKRFLMKKLHDLLVFVSEQIADETFDFEMLSENDIDLGLDIHPAWKIIRRIPGARQVVREFLLAKN